MANENPCRSCYKSNCDQICIDLRKWLDGKENGRKKMANEKRLIDANDFLDLFYVASAGQDKTFVKAVEMVLEDAPTVDAVEVVQYKKLLEMYHELRENFIDYVCSGIRNEAPYCLNKCEECVDKRGWCKLERCQGFNPAEVVLDGERKDNEVD